MTVRNVRNVTFCTPVTVTSASGVSIDTGRPDAFRTLNPAPCDVCGFSRLCRLQRRACAVFEDYVTRGRFDRDAPRRPLRAIYVRVFSEARFPPANLHLGVIATARISQSQPPRGSFCD
jgi:hypothetical protein